MSTSAADTTGPVPARRGRPWAVPGYTEVRVLGGGGFGEVVLAVHDVSGTPVAIKYLHPDLLRDPEHAAGFRAEARTLAGLDSPHVVRLYEYAENPAGAAIVMELVEGVTLAALLDREGKTTPEAALVVLYGSLLGLAAAHARGVVHRDYKPANVLIDGRGASKLTDFGIAALAGGRPVPAGTLRYMPPEQFEGAAASPAGDVYAATVTFYQCLAGRVPFDGATAQELYGKHKSAPVPMDEIPEPLRPVIARGLAKDPRSRPSDAGALAAELREAATERYGEGWEERGRSHLAEAAVLLLALLWPSGSSPAVAGSAVEHVRLTGPARNGRPPQPAHPGQPAQAAHGAQAGQPAGSNGQAGETEAGHLHHVEHVEHEEHMEHLEHVGHEEHLARLRHEEKDDERPARQRKRPRGRARTVTAVAAVAVAAVIGVAAALATTGHNSSPTPSGVPSPGGSTAAAGAPHAGHNSSPTPSGVPSPGGSTAAAGAPPAGRSALAAATTSGGSANATPATAAPAPGVLTVGALGGPLPAQLLAFAGQVLTAARAHDSAALDRLLGGNGSQTAAALNSVLAQPDTYAQIVTLLTETHTAGQDNITVWPGFLLAGTSPPLAAADLKVLGVASPQAYTGIVISIGEASPGAPYWLASISRVTA